jgi:hypothetical protein
MRTLEERLRAKLGPKDPVTGCTVWTGGGIPAGYGLISRGGRMVLAHRVAYELKHGPIPDGMKVCHSCDNPPCCNDEHLFLGTQADNMADRDAKGRGKFPGLKGEDHGRSKLTEEDVLKIRKLLAKGDSVARISQAFAVRGATIYRIQSKESWSHI